MELSRDQQEVFDALDEWVNGVGPRGGSDLLTIGGLGGTGKTTVLSHFAAQTDLRVAYCAFTGRASSILASKINAVSKKKISSLVFHPRMVESADFAHKWRGVFSSDGDASYCGTIHRLIYKPIINSNEKIIGWNKRDALDRNYDLIVVDEASMVSHEMLQDLQQLGLPILAVGDHGQLPPVMSSGSVVENPDLKLEKIHRQAEGNPIIRFAHALREGATFRELQRGNYSGSYQDDPQQRIRFGSKKQVSDILDQAYLQATRPLDVGVLCWTNKNRIALNATARKVFGRKGIPLAGEVVMCLKNRPPIYNGMRGFLVTDATRGSRPWQIQASVEFPDEGIKEHVTMCSSQFNRERAIGSIEDAAGIGIEVDKMSSLGMLFDYGYALTVHKSQGSQFDHVVVFADMPEHFEDYARFFYTAVTRSSRLLTVLL